jgi:membrane glycosyltransferase
VFIGTMALLLAPKLLSYLALLVQSATRRGCGGGLRAFLSVVIETVIAGLIAPVAMLTQSGHVVSILFGRDAGWQPQRRGDGSMPFNETAQLYWRHTCLGLLFGATAWLVSPYLALWMSPVVLGLALAIPLAAFTAATAPGRALRGLGLLRIPEEVRPPAALAQAGSLYRDLKATEELGESALDQLARDPILAEAHRHMLPPPRRRGRDPIDVPLLIARAYIDEADSATAAWNAMNREERVAALSSAEAFDRLLALISRG